MIRAKRIRTLFLCLAILSFSLSLLTGASAQQSTPELRQETFEIVWRRVKEKHYDPNLNGVDWDAVKKQYAPRVAAVNTDQEFYTLLNQMLGELKQSHFQVIPPSHYLGEEESGGSAFGAEVGIRVQLVEGRPMITRVEPNSPAAEAGLRPGFIITHIDDKPLKEVQQRLAARQERPIKQKSLLMRVIHSRLSGPVGSTVNLRYLDGTDASRTVMLERRSPNGEPIKFGELPTMYAHIETRRLAQGIGYVRFNIFMMPLLEKIKQAVQSFHDAPGIIIDLRGNPGGVGGMAMGVARLFYDERATLGTTTMRSGEIRYTVFPAPNPYTGPVAILTDEGTGSTSEILAGGMQENGRAIVVGQPSVGAVLPSVIEKLPIGARLQYAFADFKTPNGVLLEGQGVRPDVPVQIARRDLLAGRDPVLERAVSALLNQSHQPRATKLAHQAQ